MDETDPNFWTLVREDYAAHQRDWTRPGLHTLVVYRFGAWRMQIKSRALRLPFSAAYRVLSVATRNLYGLELPYTAKVGRRVVLEHQHGIVVHGQTVIGDDCVVRQGVSLGIRYMSHLEDAPVIGRGVDIGAGAKILGRVHIGDGATIGANAVVLEDVPAGALAVGVPARIISREAPIEMQAAKPVELPIARDVDGSRAVAIANGNGCKGG